VDRECDSEAVPPLGPAELVAPGRRTARMLLATEDVVLLAATSGSFVFPSGDKPRNGRDLKPLKLVGLARVAA